MRQPGAAPRGAAPPREPTDARLLAIAADHVRQFGVKRLTVVGVAEAAGMTHANVYRYFPSKAALVDAVVDGWIKQVERRLIDIVNAPDPADDKLERFVIALARSQRETLAENANLYDAFRGATAERRLVARRHHGRVKGLIDRILEEGVSSGTFHPRDREAAPAFVFDACYRFLHPAAVTAEADTPHSQFDQRLTMIVRVVLRAIGSGTI